MDSICIIIPIYHGDQYIADLIRMFDCSAILLHQYHPDVNVHLCFVNDSPERELSIYKFVLSEEISYTALNPGMHQGIHGTRLYGLNHTVSDYVLFFDQDDTLERNYLLSQYEKLELTGDDFGGVVCNGIYRGNRLIYSESRPMEMTFDRKALLEKQWNPLSPGQVLLKRKSIPTELWGRYILKHNLTDDWLLWFLMTHQGCRFQLNREVLYNHCENGTNSSLNWKEMGESRKELLEVLKQLKVLTKDEEEAFQERTDKYLRKYEKYIRLDELLEKTDRDLLIREIRYRMQDQKVAIYGLGVYGQSLFALLDDAGVEVSFCIDQHAGAIQDTAIPIFENYTDLLPQTDLIIVTPLFAYEEILATNLKCFQGCIIRMDDFISSCLENEPDNRRQGC